MIAFFQNSRCISISAAKKAGSTSLHRLQFLALNESWGLRFSKGEWLRDSRYFHSSARFLKTYSQADITDRVAVIRDPVDRARSIYKHSVSNHKRTPFKNTSVPSWQEFLENFSEICQRNTNIRNHSQSQFSSIGSLDQYHRVFTTNTISSDFLAWFNSAAAVSLKPVHKKNLKSDSITVNSYEVGLIQKIFHEDYLHYGSYFENYNGMD